jgi:hypothetical protein
MLRFILSSCSEERSSYTVSLMRSLGTKCPEHEADISFPCSAKIRNAWNFVNMPPIHLLGMVFGHSDSFNLTLYLDFLYRADTFSWLLITCLNSTTSVMKECTVEFSTL